MNKKTWLAGPYVIWSAAFVIIPLLMIGYYAMTTPDGSITLANIWKITETENLKALGLSLLLSLISTVICLILAYPLALIMRNSVRNQTSFIILLFILPMWMNFLLRTLAWQTLLEKNGVFNNILAFLGLPGINIINTPYAIILGMVYNFLPFMILPIYNVLVKIDQDVINAAADLGASQTQTFFKIIFPLSLPGVVSGIIMVFVPSLTTFVISDLLGGGKILLIGNIIEQEFKQSSNWNTGSGLSLVLMVFVLVSMAFVSGSDSGGEGGDSLMKQTLRKLYIGLILVLLYAPILTLVVLSFNDSKTRARWGGLTGRWYVELFQNDQIMAALYNTLIIAFLSALIATLIGTAAAIGINSMKKRTRTVMLGLGNIPMLNAEIVTGISLMLLFIALRFSMGFATILIAHISFNIPYVILSVMPKLKQTSRITYEAALDLGAAPLQAFSKVVLPDIFPGIMAGFLLAFTMSLDDFVITHFTKGPGVDTLSTKIYSEVRKGIKPEMYALSTLLFVAVLVLLICVGQQPSGSKNKSRELNRRRKILPVRRVVPIVLILIITAGGIYYNGSGTLQTNNTVVVYNWGEYLDPDVIDLFEAETGIRVVYEEYETNEIMYPKIQSGAIAYDLVCPSDYMIQKMIENDLLDEINFDNIPNIEYIGSAYMEKSEEFDPGNLYSVPYCWGTVGILYNTAMVDEPVTSWSVLWDEQYDDSILMQDSVRDTLGITLRYLGYSLNSTDESELNEATELLLDQKPLVQAYVIDQVRDKMIGNEAAIGVIYSGEAIYTQWENPDLEYVISEEGSNVWIDSWVIPKNARNKENAETFINFLCRPDIALMNFEYITYSTPNEAARELIRDEDIRNSEIAFPDDSELDRCETFQYLGEETDALYNQLWRKIKSK